MSEVVVRYKVKPERVAENERLIERVYAELAESDPGGLRYATFRLEDGVTLRARRIHRGRGRQQPARRDRGLRRVHPRHRRALRRAAGRAGLRGSSARTASSRNLGGRDPARCLSARCWWWLALAGLAAGGSAAGWERHSPMPEPRSEVAAASTAGELVVAGGFIADGHNSARADAYWPAGDRWRRLADLPASLDHAAGASANGRMYVIGGYGADRKPQRSVFVLEGGRWLGLAPMPDGRAAAAAGDRERPSVRARRAQRASSPRARCIRAHARNAAMGAYPGPPRASIWRPPAREAASTRSAVAPPGSTRTRRASRPTTPGRGPGAGSPRCRARAEARGRPRSAAASSRSAVSSLPARSGRCTPTTSRSSAGRACPTSRTPRHGLGVVAENGRIWVLAGGPVPGLTVSGAVESLRV